jgi:hypothetical protein
LDTERDIKTLSAAGKSSPTACQNVQFDVVFVNPYPVLTEDLSPDSSGDYWLSTLKVCAGNTTKLQLAFRLYCLLANVVQ